MLSPGPSSLTPFGAAADLGWTITSLEGHVQLTHLRAPVHLTIKAHLHLKTQ